MPPAPRVASPGVAPQCKLPEGLGNRFAGARRLLVAAQWAERAVADAHMRTTGCQSIVVGLRASPWPLMLRGSTRPRGGIRKLHMYHQGMQLRNGCACKRDSARCAGLLSSGRWQTALLSSGLLSSPHYIRRGGVGNNSAQVGRCWEAFVQARPSRRDVCTLIRIFPWRAPIVPTSWGGAACVACGLACGRLALRAPWQCPFLGGSLAFEWQRLFQSNPRCATSRWVATAFSLQRACMVVEFRQNRVEQRYSVYI